MKLVLLLAALVGCTLAQVPGFGWCPDYTPMAEFDMEKVIFFLFFKFNETCFSFPSTFHSNFNIFLNFEESKEIKRLKRCFTYINLLLLCHANQRY